MEKVLNFLRELSRNAETFIHLISHPGFKAIYPEMFDHQLKTVPKGFPLIMNLYIFLGISLSSFHPH